MEASGEGREEVGGRCRDEHEANVKKRYEVTMWIESGGEPEEDPSIQKIVDAIDKHAALDFARSMVRDENPELDHGMIWAWSIRRIYE